MKIHELIEKEENWCQNAFVRDVNGAILGLKHVNSPEAASWCLHGAIIKCYPNLSDQDVVINKLCQRVRYGLAVFNDSHNHAEVLALCKELDI